MSIVPVSGPRAEIPPDDPAPAAGAAAERAAAPARIGAAVFGAGSLVLLVGLGRPAYWLDEATTMMLVRRSWHDLARVIWRIEAPLAPYYLLMKPWSAISTAAWWVRLPSALPMALAAGLLAAWAVRRFSVLTGVAAGGLMIVLPSFTRFGQEVRPYGLMVASVVACMAAWWRWRETGGRRAAGWYAVSVAVLPLLNLLALTAVVAQVVAALLLDGPRRVRSAGRTAAVAALGLLPVSPFIVLAQARALGVAHPLPLTAANWWTTFTGIFGDLPGTPATEWMSVVVLGLAVTGLLGLRDARLRPALTAVLCWAVLPPVLLGLAAFARSTLVTRYFLISLPAWALLAGQGCAVLAGLLARPQGRRLAGLPVSVAAVAVPVLVVGAMGLPLQREYRTAIGHGQGDIRPAVALLDSPALRGVPVVVMPVLAGINALGEDPTLKTRMPLSRDAAPSGRIIRSDLTPTQGRLRLADVPRVAVLLMTGAPLTACADVAAAPALPGYRVTSTTPFSGWCVAVLDR